MAGTPEQQANKQLLMLAGGVVATGVVATGAGVAGLGVLEATGVTNFIPDRSIPTIAAPGSEAAALPSAQAPIETASPTATGPAINIDAITASPTPTTEPLKIDAAACMEDPSKCGMETQAVTPIASASPTITPSATPTSGIGAPVASETPTAVVSPTVTATATEVPTQAATPVTESRFVIDNATEATWPDMSAEAVTKWGGEADQWSRDLYQGQDGKLHWDGHTWRFEGFPLKNGVVANGDGTYNDANGKLIVNLNEIYDFSATPDFTDITLSDADPSDYASGYRGSKAPHDAGTLTYGYGNATLEDVEQAVIRKVPAEVCPPDQGGAGKWGAHKDAEQAFQTDPRIINGENSILMWDESTGTFYKMDKLVIYDAALPASYPETAKGAAEQFGGNPEQWRKDVYMKDGKAHWDGTWVFEGFPNKVPTSVDGVYLKADGTPMSEQEIYDLTPEKAQFTDIHVNDGEFATGYRGKLAPKNPGSLDVTYDESTLEGVEQAVIRVPNENGICVVDPTATAKMRATDMLNNDIIAHANTPNGFNWNENVLRMWNDIKKQFEIVTKP